jgi:hypothetical protein
VARSSELSELTIAIGDGMRTTIQRTRFDTRRVPDARRPSRWSRIMWALAGVLLLFAEGTLAIAARRVAALYAADPHWFVATYAEPSRSVAFSLVMLLSFGGAMSVALARRSSSPRRLYSTAAAMIAGLAVCLELTTAVHFNDALGHVYLHTFVYRRSEVSLGSGSGGWCVNAHLQNPFVWWLNGRSIHPKLLPLPYDSAKLVRRLSGSSGKCG